MAIESADNKGLTGLRDLLLTTVDNLKMRGFSTAKCPSDVLLALSGVGVKDRRVQFDDDGEEHAPVRVLDQHKRREARELHLEVEG